jgi:hypothetical protein
MFKYAIYSMPSVFQKFLEKSIHDDVDWSCTWVVPAVRFKSVRCRDRTVKLFIKLTCKLRQKR